MKVTIESMMEFMTFPAPGQQEVVVRTTYQTETGFRGTIDIPKADFTEKKLLKEIEKGIPEGTDLIGKTIDIGSKHAEKEE